MRCFLVLFCVLSAIWTSKCTELASFYGPSYISVPLQEAYAKNDIEFEFRTWLPDALFLLVAGRTDFLMVQLESGLIKLRINLGAGEEEISSPDGIRFDDGEWHRVFIVRREANLTMTVDSVHFVKRHLPGLFFELNIQFGVFVGGDGHFKEQFLGHMVGLRGCISNLIYGDIDLLQHARRRQGNSKVHGVTWNCDAEFDRDVSSDISFVEDNAYIMLLHSVGRGGARWQFEIKSMSNNSILLYNSDISAQAHLIAIEIISGHLNVLLNNPKSTRVTNKVSVSDNKWHKVVVHFNPSIIELTVDTTMETSRVGGSKFLDLKETYYLGGLELSQRTRAMVKGVQTADSSFKGCLRGLAVNGESIGLPNAKSTFGIKSGSCVTAGLSNKTATELDILSVAPLKVVEGRRASLTSEQVHLVTDYPRWGLRDSTVLLRVLKLFHGKIITYNGTNVDRFSLLDLLMTKVEYLHDGSETLKDEILLEIRFGDHVIPSLPLYLQQGHMFTIPVDISPMNDPPIIITGVLRVAKVCFSRDVT